MTNEIKYDSLKYAVKKYVGIALLAGSLAMPYSTHAETYGTNLETRSAVTTSEQTPNRSHSSKTNFLIPSALSILLGYHLASSLSKTKDTEKK